MQQQTTATYLDSYCERAGDPSLWAEPFNAFTNLFFFAAALAAAYALGGRSDHRFRATADIWLLIIALSAIAVGSGLWHLVPNLYTVTMDNLPIALFVNIYLIAALRRFFGLVWWKILGLWLAYTAVTLLMQFNVPPDTFHGTIMYVPTYGALLLLAAGLHWRKSAYAKPIWGVIAVWTVSLALRTLDMEICHQFPLGTHFLWHTLNAWVLFRLLTTLMQKLT